MVEVKVPKKIKIGGFDYTIAVDERHTEELKENQNWGECSTELRRIRIRSNCSPQQFSQTFLHEITHAVDDVYGARNFTEAQTHAIGQGFLQVMEQLGVRFVR